MKDNGNIAGKAGRSLIHAARSASEKSRTGGQEVWMPYVAQRQILLDKNCMCGVAHIAEIGKTTGNTEKDSARLLEVLTNFQCFERYDFMASMPDERIVRTANGDQLYLVIPRNEKASVAVNAWDAENQTILDILFNSDNGAPFLLICSHTNGIPDSQVIIAESNEGDGILAFYPCYDYEQDPVDMVRYENRLYDLTVRAMG